MHMHMLFVSSCVKGRRKDLHPSLQLPIGTPNGIRIPSGAQHKVWGSESRHLSAHFRGHEVHSYRSRF